MTRSPVLITNSVKTEWRIVSVSTVTKKLIFSRLAIRPIFWAALSNFFPTVEWMRLVNYTYDPLSEINEFMKLWAAKILWVNTEYWSSVACKDVSGVGSWDGAHRRNHSIGDLWDVSPATLENLGTKCIWSTPTFILSFFVGLEAQLQRYLNFLLTHRGSFWI